LDSRTPGAPARWVLGAKLLPPRLQVFLLGDLHPKKAARSEARRGTRRLAQVTIKNPGQKRMCLPRAFMPPLDYAPLNSQVALGPQVSGIVFNTANTSEGFHGSCLDPVSSPGRTLALSRLSASFISWRIPCRGPPEPPARAGAQ
jgi:hypothetical protein